MEKKNASMPGEVIQRPVEPFAAIFDQVQLDDRMATVTFSNANYIECKTTKTNKKKGHKPMHSAPIEKVMLLACNQRFEIGNSSR